MTAPSPAAMPRRHTAPPCRPAAVPAPRPAPDPVPAMPAYGAQVDYDPQCTVGYWNRPCAQHGCPTWVPKHRAMCASHEET
jgi:hypothetical protein